MLYITELIQEIHKRETTLEYFISIDFLLQVVALIITEREITNKKFLVLFV